MKVCYREIKFRTDSLRLIERVNAIITEYNKKGYSLTLRQVYYQLVARDIIPNNERSYKNLGNLISDGRMSGLIDWIAIEDRTRNIRANSHWDTPGDIIKSAARSYALDKWAGQAFHVEVWVEKDALVGVVGQACQRLDVPYFSCRGYVSQSEMWGAARRLQRNQQYENKTPVIIHLGDHDPSGKDMSRDIVDRLHTFDVIPIFERIALNMNQIEEYQPPPNPTKITDSRATGYISEYGYECWELDALAPEVIEQLISTAVLKYRNDSLYEEILAEEEKGRQALYRVSKRWNEIETEYGEE